MRRHVDKHLVGALCICLVIAVSFAMSAFMLDQPTPAVHAASQTIVAQPYADGFFTNWTGFPNSSSSYTNIDEAGNCNATDYNYTDTPSEESYRVRLSGIPNSKTAPASGKSGVIMKTTYRIIKIEVSPCLAANHQTNASSTINVFYRYAADANSRMIESDPRQYTVASNLFQSQPTTFWTTSVPKFSDSALEVGVRLLNGAAGAKVSQMKVKVTYDVVVEKVPASVGRAATPTITKQTLGSSVLTNGVVDLSTFQVSASGSGTVPVSRIVFKIAKSSGVTLANFRLRKNGVDVPAATYAFQYAATSTSSTVAIGSGSTGSASGTSYLVVTFKNSERINSPGAVFTLRALVSGAAPGKYVTTSFYLNQAVPPPDADKGVVPPPDADLGIVPPPDADAVASGSLAWTQTLTGL